MARQVGSRRGFASMDKEKQRAIASKGGRAAHAKGTAHEFTSDEAREAGRKGGEAGALTRGRTSSQDRGSSSGGNAGNASGRGSSGSARIGAKRGKQDSNGS